MFADLPTCRTGDCDPRLTVPASGGPVYAEVVRRDAKLRRLYRSADGTSWQRVTGVDAVPSGWLGPVTAFVTADGTYVTGEATTPRDQEPVRVRFWASRGDGEPFTQVVLSGLPSTVLSVRQAKDGWLYALSYPDGALYGSTDGWHWSAVTTR